MSKYLIPLLALILIYACRQERAKMEYVVEGDVPGLAQPIRLTGDSAVIPLADLFYSPEKYESAQHPFLKLEFDSLQKALLLIRQNDSLPVYSALNIVHNGVEYAIPVRDDAASFEGGPQLRSLRAADERVYFDVSPANSGVLALWENHALPVTVEAEEMYVQIPPQAGSRQRSHIRIYAWQAESSGNDLLIPLENGQVMETAEKLDRSDFHSNQMYFTLVDRFYDADSSNNRPLDDPRVPPIADYMGGDLKGITARIQDGYFDTLSIDAIWLSPITQNPTRAYREYPEPRRWYSGYHGYWPISSSELDDRFGTEEDLRQLVDGAHANGMNVYLDYVANHVHEDHPIYRKHPDWATDLYLEDSSMNIRIWDDQRLTTWFDTFLPTLDLRMDTVAEVQSDSALYWLVEYELDGYRHDATKHIPVKFWRMLTRKIRDEVGTERPVYQVGETYGSNELIKQYISTGLLDAQFDFNLFFTARDAFALRERSLEPVCEALQESLNTFGSHHLMANITGNHDQVRFMGLASGAVSPGEDHKEAGYLRDIQVEDSSAYDRLELLAAFTWFVPGIPIIYYGDEIGMVGAGDPDNRRMMRFEGLSERESQVFETFAALGKTRRNHMALIYGETEIAACDKSHIILKRTYFGQEAVLVINAGTEEFPYQPDSEMELAAGVIVGGRIPAEGFALFVCDEACHDARRAQE